MEIKTGLWKKKSQKGNTYCSGKFQLNGKDYYLTLFNNDKKGNEKAPDFQLLIRDGITTQNDVKVVEIPPKNSEKKDNSLNEKVFEEFGNTIEYAEDDFPSDFPF